MKFTLTIESPPGTTPNTGDLAILVRKEADRIDRAFGRYPPQEAHEGDVRGTGWLAYLTGKWLLEP